MATLPGAMMIGISSPYKRSGLLYRKYRNHFGKDDDNVLVIQAPSLALNPTLDPQIIADAMEDDPSAARAEWLGEFRVDVEAFLTREVVDAAIVPDRFELPPVSGVKYVAFNDPFGGSADDMTLAIAHQDGETAVLDCIRVVRPPFSPDDVAKDFAVVIKSYGIAKVRGDRYGGLWPTERFRVHGIAYEPSEKTKSEIYKEALPILNAGRCELLDDKKLVSQLTSLERRTARGGRDSIDHPPNAHDDVANAVTGALVLALQPVVQRPRAFSMPFSYK